MNRHAFAMLAAVSVLVPGCAQELDSADEGTIASEVRGDRFLSPAQEKRILEDIDNACGDSWCEGDFNYAFKKLTCLRSTTSCTFEFDFISTITDDEGEEIGSFRLPTTCTFNGIRRLSDIASFGNGTISYSDAMYDRVSDCINTKERPASQEAWRLEADFMAKRCSQTKVKGVAFAETALEAWDRDAMIARAKTLGAQHAFASGPFSYEITDGLHADLDGSEATCNSWLTDLKRSANIVSVAAANASDETGVVVIVRKNGASKTRETVFYLSSSN